MRHVRTTTCCLAAALCLGSAATTWADYINPPPFVPQRTVCWNFDSDPGYEPVVLVGPAWQSMGGGHDWAGTDPVDAWQWQETDPTWPDHTGLLVIENTGQDPITVFLTFSLDNYPDPLEIKEVWDEAVYKLDGRDPPVDQIDFYINGPGGVPFQGLVIDNQVQDAYGGYSDNAYAYMEPNPEYEEFIWELTLAPGSKFLLDRYCVSTLCVPAPGSLCLLGLGALCCRRR